MRRHLTFVDFRAADGAETIAIQVGDEEIMTVLVLPFVHRIETDRTALIAVIQGTTGDPLVYALLREGDGLVAALSVDAAGEIQTRSALAALAAAPRPMSPRADPTHFAAAMRAQVPPDPCRRCDWCDYLCGNFGPDVVCGVATAPVCAPSVVGGAKPAVVCAVIFGIFCNLVAYYGCGVMCGATQCGACDQGCENRATDCVNCTDTCPALTPGTVCCQGQCTDASLLQDDLSNCGACGNDCRDQVSDAFGEPVCCGGQCCEFSSFLTACCSGQCTSMSSADHCGGCNSGCPRGQVCHLGGDSRWQCGACDGDFDCAACETCNEQTGECEETCGPCEMCDRTTGECRSSCGPCELCSEDGNGCVSRCVPPAVCQDGRCVDEARCPDGGESCPGYLYGCCPPGQHCCHGMDWCCDDGCICCGTLWCCCDGLRCSEYLTGCE